MNAATKLYSSPYASVMRWRYCAYDLRKDCGCSIITLVPNVANQPKNVGDSITVARTRTSSSL